MFMTSQRHCYLLFMFFILLFSANVSIDEVGTYYIPHTTPARQHTSVHSISHTFYVFEAAVLKTVQTKGQNEKINNLCCPVACTTKTQNAVALIMLFCRHLHIGRKPFHYHTSHMRDMQVLVWAKEIKRSKPLVRQINFPLVLLVILWRWLHSTMIPRTYKMDALSQILLFENMCWKYFFKSGNHHY